VRHNHITRDIKPLGQCPACDAYHDRHIPKPTPPATHPENVSQKLETGDKSAPEKLTPTQAQMESALDHFHAMYAKPTPPAPLGLPVDDKFLESRVDDSWRPGLMSAPEPRKWTLDWGHVTEGPTMSTTVHVVEKSAYDAVVKERDELKRQVGDSRIYAQHADLLREMISRWDNRDGVLRFYDLIERARELTK